MVIWYTVGDQIGSALGFTLVEASEPVVGIEYFYTPAFLWFYLFYVVWVALFALFWFVYSPHRWQLWSIVGSAFILFTTYYGVQVSVAINNWRRPFFDTFQQALSGSGQVTAADLYGLILIFAFFGGLGGMAVVATHLDLPGLPEGRVETITLGAGA